MNQPNAIHSTNAPKPVGLYPHARRVGDFIFLSGVGPRLPGSGQIPGTTLDSHGNVLDYSITDQCESVFRNVEAILNDAGAKLTDLVDITVFLTDMKRDFPTFNKLYAEKFQGTSICRTTVEVSRLPTPIAIELKCLAYFPEKK